jgi:hypothetical protein
MMVFLGVQKPPPPKKKLPHPMLEQFLIEEVKVKLNKNIRTVIQGCTNSGRQVVPDG